jgi:hypothetical protein
MAGNSGNADCQARPKGGEWTRIPVRTAPAGIVRSAEKQRQVPAIRDCLLLKLIDPRLLVDMIIDVVEATRPAPKAAAVQEPIRTPRSIPQGMERADLLDAHG